MPSIDDEALERYKNEVRKRIESTTGEEDNQQTGEEDMRKRIESTTGEEDNQQNALKQRGRFV